LAASYWLVFLKENRDSHMGTKRKRSKKDKKKRKKRKVESSSSDSSSSSSDSDSENMREELTKIMCKLVDLSREMDSPISALKNMFQKLNSGEKVVLKHMAHKPTKKLLTKLFFTAELKEKKRDVWKMRTSSPDLVPILEECIPKDAKLEDAHDLVTMLITEDPDTASAHLRDVLKSIDEQKYCEIPDDCEPQHFWEFAELLFEYLLMEKSGDIWKTTRSTPPNLQKLFRKQLNKIKPSAAEENEAFGCALPPGFSKKKIEVHESQGPIGPTIPQIQDDPEVLEMASVPNGNLVGPAIPTSAQMIQAKQIEAAESSDDDDYGPANLADGESMTKQDKRRAMRMMQIKELQDVEEKYKMLRPSSAKREDWMNMPSGDMGSMFGKQAHDQRSRGFSTKEVDKSAWTMTQQERDLEKQKQAEIDAINAKYAGVKAKPTEQEKEAPPEFQAPKQKSMVEAHLSNLPARIVSWEIRKRRGGRVGPKPGSSTGNMHESVVPQNFVQGGFFR